MKRLFSLVSALSLAFLVITCVIWVRSYYGADVIRWKAGESGIVMFSTRGQLATAVMIGTKWSDESHAFVRIADRNLMLDATPAGGTPLTLAIYHWQVLFYGRDVTVGLYYQLVIPIVSADRFVAVPHAVVAGGFSLLPLMWLSRRLLHRRKRMGFWPIMPPAK